MRKQLVRLEAGALDCGEVLMLLETLVSASEAVQATPKRRQKVGRLAECLRSAGSDAAICVAFLCGDLRQGKLGVGYGTCRPRAPQVPPSTPR